MRDSLGGASKREKEKQKQWKLQKLTRWEKKRQTHRTRRKRHTWSPPSVSLETETHLISPKLIERNPPGGFPIYYVPSSRTVNKRTPLEAPGTNSSRGVLFSRYLFPIFFDILMGQKWYTNGYAKFHVFPNFNPYFFDHFQIFRPEVYVFFPKFDAFFWFFANCHAICVIFFRILIHIFPHNSNFYAHFFTIFQAFFFEVLPIFMLIVFIIFQILSHNFSPFSSFQSIFFRWSLLLWPFFSPFFNFVPLFFFVLFICRLNFFQIFSYFFI